MKIKLSTMFINNELTCPEGRKQIEYCDTEVPGLYVLVSNVSPGIGTYYLRYKDETGKTKHKKICRTDVIKLKESRDRAKYLKLEIAQGKDPQAETKKKRNEMTYGELMEEYYFPYITPRRRSAKGYRQMYDTHLKLVFGDMKVSQITKQLVQTFQNDLQSLGLANGTINRYHQLLKSSINHIISMEIIDLARNPAVGIGLLPEVGKERYLSEEELSRLLPVLTQDSGTISKIIQFLLASGLRLNECLRAEWKNIDMQNKLMVIPSKDAKSTKVDSIPVNSVMIKILESCSRTTPYPFSNPKTGKPYVSIKKGFAKLMRQAGIEGVTAHTMRHSFASCLINQGVSLYLVQRLLRHSSSKVTEKYSHLTNTSVMAASDAISETLFRAAAGNQ